MGQHKLSPADRALFRAVDEVLHYIWDPIGVSRTPVARDEYSAYLPQVFKLVRENCSEAAIADYLGAVATDRMGLSSRKQRDFEVARLLLKWQRVIGEQFPQ